MNIRVITPPEPFLTPADIAGAHQPDDAKIAAMIAAATEEIDGYTGWLGRCLGPQQLEWQMSNWPCHYSNYPIGPVLEDGEAIYIDPTGTEQSVTVPSLGFFHPLPSVRGQPGDLRIRYWAGYGVRNTQDPEKWDEKVPARVKQAVIMMVQHMKALSAENLFLRSETVEGVGARTYTVSDQAGAIIHDTAKRLLSGLRVRRV